MSLPMWKETFQSHIDVTELGAGVVLTYTIDGLENVNAYGSKR